jgi:hypothetical protein
MIMVSLKRSHRIAPVLAFVLFLAGASAAPAATSAPASQLAPFAWLIGGAWRADTSSLPGGLKYIETRYDLAPNGRLIRFTTAFVNGDGSVPNGYAGNLYFDPSASTLKLWYLDTKNEIIQATVTPDGNAFSMTFLSDGAVIGVSGAVTFRADVKRMTNDSYAWSLFAQVKDAWKPVFSLTYARAPGGNG